MMFRHAAWAALLAASSVTFSARAAAPPAIDLPALSAAAARRFPQPVRVGDLLGKDVLKPVESQPVLGHVAAVVHRPDGGLDVIIHYGGLFGAGSHPIAVPAEAIALVGPSVAAVGFTPEQLDRFPAVPFPHAGTLGPNEEIRLGIVRPFH